MANGQSRSSKTATHQADRIPPPGETASRNGRHPYPNGTHHASAHGSVNGSPNGSAGAAEASSGRSIAGSPDRQACSTRYEVESLGVSLGPALHEACSDRLGDIQWFQSPWQKSGAATGFTSWRLPDGSVVGAIAKVPVGYREYFWSTRLGEVDPMWWNSVSCRHLPVPRVLASGTELAGYDIAWLVVERVSGKPVSGEMTADSLERMFAAAAKFHAMALEITPVDRSKADPPPDWDKVLSRAHEACEVNHLEGAEEWMECIDRVRAILPRLLERWNGRPMDTWCHGDLHPGNAMTRCDATCPEDRCGVLIDLALVHPGHWVEDALYLERLHWGRENLLCGIDPVEALARHRRALGLPADEGDHELADVRRILMGATSPAFLRQENDRTYLAAALGYLRRLIPIFSGSK